MDNVLKCVPRRVAAPWLYSAVAMADVTWREARLRITEATVIFSLPLVSRDQSRGFGEGGGWQEEDRRD